MKKNRLGKELSLLAVRPLMWLHTFMSWDFDQQRQWNRRIRQIRGSDRRLLGNGEELSVERSRGDIDSRERGYRRGGGLLRTAVFGGLVLGTAMMTAEMLAPTTIHISSNPVVAEVSSLPNEAVAVPYAQPPREAIDHAIQGYYHQIQKQDVQALEEYNAALRIFPNYPDVQWNKAMILNRLAQYAQAVDVYRDMLRINPNDTDALYNMGYALDKLARYPEALDSYNQILKIDAADIHAPIGKGVVQYHLGDIDGAIVEFVKVIDTNPKYSLYNLACMYSVKGDQAQALQLLERALPYMDQKMMDVAKQDPDFKNIRDTTQFRAMIYGDANP